ncbi:Protein Wnt-8 like protein [Argiope bruennichi]|uniref:Protein Wnt n=1 Tax=Argiope bruennichi TaxID=94029 RepID=A0A8T0E4A6_ARGBR|nr:Protein Wnt-8 like protein [Argiope bruennichi]
MWTKVLLVLSFSLCAMVDSSAWSLSNIMLSGSKANDVFTESVLIGAERGMEECKHQFQWDRWGCPRSSFNMFSKSSKQPATKEMAFLHAMISSSIVITVTKNCSLGHFKSCGCDESKKGGFDYKGWHWGGCSDHVKMGNKMAKLYLDNKENGRDLKALINLHNYRVGRLAVKRSMTKTCKCHGVSGSCEIQTCWMRTRGIREVGDILKDAYHKAQLFSTNINGFNLPLKIQKRKMDNRIPHQQVHERLKIPKQQLAYLEHSPNYCVANASLGVPGTRGRMCSRMVGKNVTKAERQSCRNLCRVCGYKVQMKIETRTERCSCKFTFCCQVSCKTCDIQHIHHMCD